MYNKGKPISFAEVLSKLMKFCAYQERSVQEVRTKAFQLGVQQDKIDELLEQLIKEGFLNEERFAERYVQGKVNIKRWGKYRISQGLFSKGISGELADRYINQIDEERNLENLNYWIAYKLERMADAKAESDKLYRFLLSKGFESNLVLMQLKEKSLM